MSLIPFEEVVVMIMLIAMMLMVMVMMNDTKCHITQLMMYMRETYKGGDADAEAEVDDQEYQVGNTGSW